MSSVLNLPESMRDYMLKPGVETAVDHLLTMDGDDFPQDLNWDEVLSFHDALLMAAKVRRDYVAVLMEAWQLIWAPVVKEHRAIEEIPFSEYDPEALPAPKAIWDDALYRVFKVEGRRQSVWLHTAVAASPKEGLVIYVAIEEDQKGRDLLADTAGLELWIPDENSYWRSKESGQINETGPIALRELIAAAEEAIAQVLGVCDV